MNTAVFSRLIPLQSFMAGRVDFRLGKYQNLSPHFSYGGKTV